MQPEDVQLTPIQKIKPLLRAINNEIPWPIAMIVTISLIVGINAAIVIQSIFTIGWLNMVESIVVALAGGVATFFAIAFAVFFVEDKMRPIFLKICDGYEEEALKTKKEVLENVVDDEILLKK